MRQVFYVSIRAVAGQHSNTKILSKTRLGRHISMALIVPTIFRAFAYAAHSHGGEIAIILFCPSTTIHVISSFVAERVYTT